MLEEYLALHRPLLVGDKDPGTIFVGKRGGPLSAQLTVLISNLTACFAGCRILPAWIRLAFAFCFLARTRVNYLTLSRVLGHADVRSTISMFAIRTYVSGAMRNVEAWASAVRSGRPSTEKMLCSRLTHRSTPVEDRSGGAGPRGWHPARRRRSDLLGPCTRTLVYLY